MKISIRSKLFLTMCLMIVVFVALSWLANILFLKTYYSKNKKDSILETYGQISDLMKTNPNDFKLQMEKLENDKSLRILIFDKDFNVFYDSLPQNLPLQRRGPTKNFDFRNFQESIIQQNLEKLKDGKPIMEEQWDGRLKTNFISFLSTIPPDKYIFISTAMTPIQESAKIANAFFVIIGIITILIGSIIIYLISSRSTKPILTLVEIAKSMEKLDFSKKYTIHTNDEIQTLGHSINSMSEQLEKSISELTAANAMLREDIEKERKIDEMRKNFISNVSHELKTPISLIQGYAEGLKLNVNEDEENKNYYCEVIIDEALKMDKLVKNLLNLSQLESGHPNLDLCDFNISDLIEKIIKKNSIILKDKEINVETELDTNIDVHADFYKIEQVLVNFVNNAINHVNDSKIVRIYTKNNDTHIRVFVYNSGSHIPEDSLDKIWMSFYKVDKARTRDYGGTGLGLAVVRAICDAHKFAYGTQNVDGGVEFWFELARV